MYRIGLNLAKKDNFMFFDFDAPLCLSITNNWGEVERLTPNILKALKIKKLLDLDGTIDLTDKKVSNGTNEVEDKDTMTKEDNKELVIEDDSEVQDQEKQNEIEENKVKVPRTRAKRTTK